MRLVFVTLLLISQVLMPAMATVMASEPCHQQQSESAHQGHHCCHDQAAADKKTGCCDNEDCACDTSGVSHFPVVAMVSAPSTNWLLTAFAGKPPPFVRLLFPEIDRPPI